MKIYLGIELLQTSIVGIGVICYYIAIFLSYRKRVQKITEEVKDNEIFDELVKVEKSNQRQLIVFCVSICQLYLYRIVRDSIYYFKNFDERNDGGEYYIVAFSISKIVFILGILMSLEKQIQNAQPLDLNTDLKDTITVRNISEKERENIQMTFEDADRPNDLSFKGN